MCVRSRVWFFATPYTLACQAPLSMGFSRQDYWSRLPFPTLEIMHIMYELDARAHSCRQVELKILYEGLFLPTQCSFTVTLQASAVMKPSFWIQSFSFHTLSPHGPERRLWSCSLLRRTCHWDSDLTLFFAPWPSPCPLTSSQGQRLQFKSLTSSRAPPSSLLEGMRLNRCKAFIGAWHMVDNHCLQISFLRSGNFELVSTELYWLLWLSTAIQEWYFRHKLFWYYWLNL